MVDRLPRDVVVHVCGRLERADVLGLRLSSRHLASAVDLASLFPDKVFRHAVSAGNARVAERCLFRLGRLPHLAVDFEWAARQAVHNDDAAMLAVLASSPVFCAQASGADLRRVAAEGGSKACLAWILAAAVPLASPDDGFSLHVAVEAGHLDIVRMLLQANVAGTPEEVNDALALAAARGKTHIAGVLVASARAHPSASNYDGLVAAAAHGHIPMLDLLLACPNVHVPQRAFVAACANGRVPVVARLLQRPEVITALCNDALALNFALNFGHDEIADLIEDAVEPFRRPPPRRRRRKPKKQEMKVA